MRLDVRTYRSIVILTGAGISAASGLPTYRGPGGLWEDEAAANLVSAGAWQRDPVDVWRHASAMRAAARAAEPNAAHRVLVELESRAPGAVTVVTQNVDGLHRRAGSREVVELHGNVFRTRCEDGACELPAFEDDALPEAPPPCPCCGARLRPDLVLFDEPLPGAEEWRAKRALRDCDLFLAVGTSGTVSPAAEFVRAARYAQARTILVNLEPLDPPDPAFQEQVLGPAEVELPRLLLSRS